MIDQRKAILDIAKKQIGSYPATNKFNKWYGAPGQAYCAMFVSYCAAHAQVGTQTGISTDIIPKLAYVPYEYEWFLKRGRWHSKGSGYKPQPGDLVIFGTNSHIGIVEKISGTTLYTIEGNTTPTGNTASGDGVYRKQRGMYSDWVKGYCSPAYIVKDEDDDMDLKTFKGLYDQMRKEWQDNDCTNDPTMAAARKWAVDNGLIKGNKNGQYMWQDVPTREQLMTILYRWTQMIEK